MARTITDEEIKLSIVINGNPAQKQLLDLEKDTRKLTEANKDLNLERKRLEAQGKKDTVEYKKLSAEIKANTREIDNNKAVMKELQNQIGLTGLTIAQLTSKAGQLRMSLRNVIPGSEDYRRYEAELRQVNDRLSELNGRARQSRFSIGSLADSFNRYAALGASVIATLTGVVLSIQKIIDYNGKLSDTQADVMKTTGMTRKEVDELTKSFGLLQTRTSRIDLLKIAEQGGRIGIAKEEIGSFVEVMNKASVSLGDSFTGGVEEVANKLGKLKFLFQETKDMSVDQAYNSIGSAINDLGANGVASEANIADFATRIGSLTDVLKPTIRETLALGAAFEESGIESEVSARAYNIFMKQASTESAKFAQVMGISQKSIEGMINTNPLEFMLKFAEGMRGMDATETAKTLDFLGVNADGANKVIGAMGNNMGRFRELIDLSNGSFESGTSLITEYNIKNETLGATLEKIKKTVTGWFSSETFVKWLTTSAQALALLIGATNEADGKTTKWRENLVFSIKIISTLIVGMVSYRLAIQSIAFFTNTATQATILNTIAQKANALSGGTLGAVYRGLQYIFFTLTLQTDKATIAQERFNLATKMNPIGLIIGVIMAAVAAYYLFSKEVDKSIIKQQTLNSVRETASKAVIEEKKNLEDLLKIARDENQSKENRLAAIKKINEINPEYLKGITLETINTLEAKKAIDSYLVSLDKKAMKEAFANKRTELSGNLITAINDEEKRRYGGFFQGKNTDFKETYEAEINNINKFKSLTNGWNSYKMNAYRDYKNSILDAEDQLKSLTIEEEKFIKKNAGLYVENPITTKSDFTTPDGNADGTKTKKDPNSSKSDLDKLKYDEEAKFQDELLKLKRRYEEESIAIMTDGYEKDLALENLRYIREMQDLERMKIHKDEIIKLDAEISKAKVDGDLTKVAALTQIKESYAKKNEIIDKKINDLEITQIQIHNLKVATIEEKAATEKINKSKEKFDLEKTIRETKFQEELVALGNNEKAKAKLTKEFELSELAHQEEFLKELIEKFNIIVGKGQFENIDLSLLTPEQVADFEKEAAKVGLTLAELINKKNALSAKGKVDDINALGIGGGSADIFGFTPDNWVTLFGNLEKGKVGINEMVFAVSALTNMYSQYSDFLTANENASLKRNEQVSNKKKQNLKRQLDAGYINQIQYNRGVEKIDNDLAKQKAELEYKQAKRQKAIAAANIITSTAQAIIGIWAQFPKFDFGATAAIMSGVVGGLGALQLATVLATPLPAKGYEQGLYPDYVKREQDGKIFQSTGTSPMQSGLFSKPRILVGEGPGSGPEMVIDKKAYAQIPPNIKNALINSLRGIKGFENGYYNQDKMRIEIPAGSTPAPGSSNDAMMEMNMAVMAETLAVLKDLRENPLIAMVSNKDYKSMKNLLEGLEDYKKLIEKTKR